MDTEGDIAGSSTIARRSLKEIYEEEGKVRTVFSSGERLQLITRRSSRAQPTAVGGANINMALAELNYKLAKAGIIRGRSQEHVKISLRHDGPASEGGEDGEESPNIFICVKYVFPLHDVYEYAYLRRQWATTTVPCEALKRCDFWGMAVQPIENVRYYHGSQPAMYFAFLESYTNSLLWPALLGLLTLVGHVFNGVEMNPLTPAYSVLVSIWAIMFLSKWGSRQLELQHLWATDDYEDQEMPRKEFLTGMRNMQVLNEFFGEVETVVPSAAGAAYSKCGSTMTILFCILTVIMAALVAMWIKLLDFSIFFLSASIIGSLFNVVCIQTFSRIYAAVAEKLNDIENIQQLTAYQDALIIKNFLFQFVNYYFAMRSIVKNMCFSSRFSRKVSSGASSRIARARWFHATCSRQGSRPRSPSRGSRPTRQHALRSSPAPSCRAKGSASTSTMARSRSTAAWASCRSSCWWCSVKQFAFQLIEVGVPFLKVRAAIARRNAKAAVKGLVCGRELTTNDMRCKQEFESVDYAGVFMDYNELAIQFGYTTLFAVAFPAAPMLAFVNNVIEARSDAWKLCSVYKRDEFARCQDIGAWEGVFNAVAVMAIMTNAVLTGFVGSQLTHFIDGDASEMLDQNFRHRDCRFWAAVIFFEHMVLLFRLFLRNLVDLEPTWIDKAQLVITKLNKQLVKTDAMRARERQRKKQNREKRAARGGVKTASIVKSRE